MDTLQKEERWQRDRDLFVERAKELDAEVLVEAAERDDAKQLQQAESLLERGVQALVVVPHNAEAAGKIVEAAKKRSVPVISYDRLILNADVDLYLSYDNRRVGEQQAQYLRNQAPKGNYILLGGAPTDHNAKLIREGQMAALEDARQSRRHQDRRRPWATDWQADAAMDAHRGGTQEGARIKSSPSSRRTTRPRAARSRRSKSTASPARSSSRARTRTSTPCAGSSPARRA